MMFLVLHAGWIHWLEPYGIYGDIIGFRIYVMVSHRFCGNPEAISGFCIN